jgi:hypothetical protein
MLIASGLAADYFFFVFHHLAAEAFVAFFFRSAGVNAFADALPPSLASRLKYALTSSDISSFAIIGILCSHCEMSQHNSFL